MRKLLVACFSLITVCLHAQDNSFTDTRKPFIKNDTVYVEAGFPGGDAAWKKYLEANLHPTTAADHNAPAGNYFVTVSFCIDTAGNLKQAILLRDPGYGTGEDVLRVLNNSPKWLPATINGKPVVYRQKQNFTYQVSEL
jgi:protein TonB